MGQRAAGLGNHLPGMAHIADAGRGDVDIQGGSCIAHIAHIGGSYGKECEKCVVHFTHKYLELFNSLFNWRSLHHFRKLFVQIPFL